MHHVTMPLQASVGLARQQSAGHGTWWESFFGANKTGTSTPDGTPALSPPPVWTSKPKSRTKKPRDSSPTVSSSTPVDPSPMPQAAKIRGITVSDTIAAGIQEGISSISQLTGYFRGDSNQRSAESSPSRDTSAHGRCVFRSDSAEGLSAPTASHDLPGPWQIIWRDTSGRDTLQTLTFEASIDTRTQVQSIVCPTPPLNTGHAHLHPFTPSSTTDSS